MERQGGSARREVLGILVGMIAAATAMQEQVDQVLREFSPEVVRIRFNNDNDWTGDPAIYFRAILSDEASRPERRRTVASKLRGRLHEIAEVLESGRIAYIHVRSESDQAKLREASWE